MFFYLLISWYFTVSIPGCSPFYICKLICTLALITNQSRSQFDPDPREDIICHILALLAEPWVHVSSHNQWTNKSRQAFSVRYFQHPAKWRSGRLSLFNFPSHNQGNFNSSSKEWSLLIFIKSYKFYLSIEKLSFYKWV